jgi:hypothetical protein
MSFPLVGNLSLILIQKDSGQARLRRTSQNDRLYTSQLCGGMVYFIAGNNGAVYDDIDYKIPPYLPFPKGGNIPLFSKEGRGEIFR